MDLCFNVENQIITRTDTNKVVADSRNYIYAEFSFSDEWTGTVTAVFKKGAAVFNVILDENNRCPVPWEAVTAGRFSVSCFCGDRITANTVTVNVIASGYGEGETPGEPTPDVYSAITGMCADAVSKSDAVFTAYENGELKGEKGDSGLGRAQLDLSAGTRRNPINIGDIENGSYDVSEGGWICSDYGQTAELSRGDFFLIDSTQNYMTYINSTGVYVICTDDEEADWSFSFTPTYDEVSDMVLHRYSAEEHAVGTWLDGRPLYEKTVVFDLYDLPSQGLTNGTEIPVNVSGVDILLLKEQYFYDNSVNVGSSSKTILPMYQNLATSVFCYFDMESKKIKVSNTSSTSLSKPSARNVRQLWLVCRYTKTGD